MCEMLEGGQSGASGVVRSPILLRLHLLRRPVSPPAAETKIILRFDVRTQLAALFCLAMCLAGCSPNREQPVNPPPNDVDVRPIVREAERLADSGSLKEALAKMDEAARMAPHEHRVLLIKAKMLETANNFRDAEKCAAEAHRIAPNDLNAALALLRYGQGYMSKSDLEALGRQAVSIGPDSAEAHYLLGVAIARSDDPQKLKEAIAEYQKAYQLNPQQASSLIDMARAHSRLGDNSTATALLERSAALLDSRPAGKTVVQLEQWITQRRETAFWLAQAYRRSGNSSSASKAAAQATQLSDRAHEIKSLRDRAASQPPDATAKSRLASLAERGMAYWK